MAPLLQLTNLSLCVGRTQLVENATCLCLRGQRIALVGSNGCGKSTLLRAIAASTAESDEIHHNATLSSLTDASSGDKKSGKSSSSSSKWKAKSKSKLKEKRLEKKKKEKEGKNGLVKGDEENHEKDSPEEEEEAKNQEDYFFISSGEIKGCFGNNNNPTKSRNNNSFGDDDKEQDGNRYSDSDEKEDEEFNNSSTDNLQVSNNNNNNPNTRILYVQQDNLHWKDLLFGSIKQQEEEQDKISNESVLKLTLPEAFDLSIAYSATDPDTTNASLEDEATWQRVISHASRELGWDKTLYDKTPLGLLSPGCALRAFLTIALHRVDIDLLLLDEPTNHLDLPTRYFLEKLILASRKAVIVVSHDTTFLDNVCDHLWVIHDPATVPTAVSNLEVSSARYSDYKHAKELARQQQMEAYDAQQKRNKRLTSVADKLRAASVSGNSVQASDNDKLARGALRNRAGRSGKKAKAVEKLRDAHQETVERVIIKQPLVIEINPEEVSTGSSIKLSSVVLGYSDSKSPNDSPPQGRDGSSTALKINPISLNIEFGEHLAIVGFNGVGKSTLLKTITGDLKPLCGDVSIGNQLIVGNLMQEHDNLPRDQTPREYFARLGQLTPLQACGYLIKYGLTLCQVDCPISFLNPGARARALLCGFAMKHVNTLILDEPSNHLDEEAIMEVVETLKHFKGIVVAVSHDYSFLKTIMAPSDNASSSPPRVLKLDSQGLTEIDSVDDFVQDVEDAVERVIAASRG
eukprot:Nk52_evm7s290 gene=Nk52_evmTU7s290